MKLTLLIPVAVALASCKDASGPAPLEAAVDRAKAVATGDRLPERSSEAAVTNHGLAKLQDWAEGGDSKAQHFVAVAYLTGNSAPKNFEVAAKWALRAANQGSAPSQFLIGLIRKEAAASNDLLAVEPNLVHSYMWLSLAAAQGHPQASAELNHIQTPMNPEWVRRAQSMAATWRPCKDRACQDQEPDPCPPAPGKDGSLASLLCSRTNGSKTR
jgi:TPR repeat protein